MIWTDNPFDPPFGRGRTGGNTPTGNDSLGWCDEVLRNSEPPPSKAANSNGADITVVSYPLNFSRAPAIHVFGGSPAERDDVVVCPRESVLQDPVLLTPPTRADTVGPGLFSRDRPRVMEGPERANPMRTERTSSSRGTDDGWTDGHLEALLDEIWPNGATANDPPFACDGIAVTSRFSSSAAGPDAVSFPDVTLDDSSIGRADTSSFFVDLGSPGAHIMVCSPKPVSRIAR